MAVREQLARRADELAEEDIPGEGHLGQGWTADPARYRAEQIIGGDAAG